MSTTIPTVAVSATTPESAVARGRRPGVSDPVAEYLHECLRRLWERETCVICAGTGVMCIIDADIWPLMLTKKARRCRMCGGRGWVWRWRRKR